MSGERIPFTLWSGPETYTIISTDAGLHADDPRLEVCRYLNRRRPFRTVTQTVGGEEVSEYYLMLHECGLIRGHLGYREDAERVLREAQAAVEVRRGAQ